MYIKTQSNVLQAAINSVAATTGSATVNLETCPELGCLVVKSSRDGNIHHIRLPDVMVEKSNPEPITVAVGILLGVMKKGDFIIQSNAKESLLQVGDGKKYKSDFPLVPYTPCDPIADALESHPLSPSVLDSFLRYRHSLAVWNVYNHNENPALRVRCINNVLEMTAMDRFHGSYFKVPVEDSEDFDFTLPFNSFSKLVDLLYANSSSTFVVEQNRVFIKSSATLINIPKVHSNSGYGFDVVVRGRDKTLANEPQASMLGIKTEALRDAVKTASTFLSENTRMTFVLGRGFIEFRYSSSFGRYSSKIPAEVEINDSKLKEINVESTLLQNFIHLFADGVVDLRIRDNFLYASISDTETGMEAFYACVTSDS